MPFPLLLAIGAGLGLTKSLAVDGPRASRQRKLAAETQRLNPWTGMQSGPIQEADPLGSTLQFGLAGHQIAQGMAQDALNEKIADRIGGSGYTPINVSANAGGGGNPWSVMPSMYGSNPFGLSGNYGY